MRAVLSRITFYSLRFDPRTRWLATGRSLLAVAQLTILVFTPTRYLFPPVLGQSRAPVCERPVQQASVFCLAGHHHLTLAQVIASLGLIVVASGIYPRWTSILHFWICLSLGASLSLPDGGESVARIVSFFLIFVCAADDRRWQWSRPSSTMPSLLQPVSFIGLWCIRVQMAFIYADSAISKFGVADWANGTAEYYIVRDPLFGSAGPFGPLMDWITSSPVGTLAMSWSALLVELILAYLMLTPVRWKLALLILDIALHGAIILTMGLWSFGLIMIASSIVASSPLLIEMDPLLNQEGVGEGLSHAHGDVVVRPA